MGKKESRTEVGKDKQVNGQRNGWTDGQKEGEKNKHKEEKL